MVNYLYIFKKKLIWNKMKKNNYSLVFDENSKSLKIRNMLLKKINITPISKSDLIIVLGGDGFMLKTLKRYHKSKKSFME